MAFWDCLREEELLQQTQTDGMMGIALHFPLPQGHTLQTWRVLGAYINPARYWLDLRSQGVIGSLLS